MNPLNQSSLTPLIQLVQDKSGTQYFFGLDDARQQSVWPSGVAQSFAWHLSKVVDMNGKVNIYGQYLRSDQGK